MNADIAIICGAGWKVWCQAALPPVLGDRLPEALYPIGSGTVVSRLVEQAKIVFNPSRIIVAVGHPDDCSYAKSEGKIIAKVPWSASCYSTPGIPWTHERVEAVRELGVEVYLHRNPARFRFLHTLAEVLRNLLKEDGWSRIFVTAGDYVLDTTYLRMLADEIEYPSMVWFKPCHPVLFLDRAEAERVTQITKGGSGAVWRWREDNFTNNVYLHNENLGKSHLLQTKETFCELEPGKLAESLAWGNWIAMNDKEIPYEARSIFA